MALEIAQQLKPRSVVLDVGCGNGFITHHLKGILDSTVIGLDVGMNTSANINYLSYDGRHFPIGDRGFDAVLLCYVLHHAQNAQSLLEEVHRVLRNNGLVIVYEDSPARWFDRAVCWTHNLQWRKRTGPCTFQLENEWRRIFALAGFDVIKQRKLSRWRNLAHPVSRTFFVLSQRSGFNKLDLQPQLLNSDCCRSTSDDESSRIRSDSPLRNKLSLEAQAYET